MHLIFPWTVCSDAIFCHSTRASSMLHARSVSCHSEHDGWAIRSLRLWAAWLPVMWSIGRSHADKCPQLLLFFPQNCTSCFRSNVHVQKRFRGSRRVRWCAAADLLEYEVSSVTAGPGPGRYGLPPTIGFVGHDYTKPTCPAYSFHGRMTDTSKLFSSVAFKVIGRRKCP